MFGQNLPFLCKKLSSNISKFLTNKTTGNGFSQGNIKNDKLIIKNYEYVEEKENSTKIYSIDFNDQLNIIGKRTPPFDKSKLSSIDKNMLIDVIDPAIGFYLLSNFLNLDDCTKELKLFDAKRRFNLLLTKISEGDDFKKCLIKTEKIGGYKIKDDLNPLELPYEMIIEYKLIEGSYKMTTIKGKNKIFNIILERKYPVIIIKFYFYL